MHVENRFKENSPGPLIYKFFSRRNHVFLFKSEILKTNESIIKFYSEPHAELKCRIEFENLKTLHNAGIKVPRIKLRNPSYNIMEYIPGVLVSDLAYGLDMGPWIEKLAHHIYQIHSIGNDNGNYKKNKNNDKYFLKGDCNLRNFIYCKNEIYGLDFEENAYGDRRTDIGEICFFLVDNKSPDPKKVIMAQRFLRAYENLSGPIEDFSYFLKKSALNAKKRRKIREKFK